jgi:hypothetical protein
VNSRQQKRDNKQRMMRFGGSGRELGRGGVEHVTRQCQVFRDFGRTTISINSTLKHEIYNVLHAEVPMNRRDHTHTLGRYPVERRASVHKRLVSNNMMLPETQ